MRKTLTRAAGTVVVMVLAMFTMAHVGSPDTWFEGQAGPYPVQVVIRLPGVVPGLGQIDITVPDDDVTRVTAQPMIFNAGPEGAPPPDVAQPVKGQARTWHAELWFMEQATYRVRIEVSGARGSGTVDVPIVAAAMRQTPLAPWLGTALLLAAGVLFVGAVTIVRAGATDALAAPGAGSSNPRGGRAASVAGGGVLGLMLFGGWQWWQAVDSEYQDSLYRRVPAIASVDTTGGVRTLIFTVTDSNWMVQRVRGQLLDSPIIPDHGKLMHLFAIERDNTAGRERGFGHFHPITTDSLTFRTALGGLAAGYYDLYADVVQETGYPQTLVASVEIPPPQPNDAGMLGDEADAVHSGVAAADRVVLRDGGTAIWDGRRDSLRAGTDAGLRFQVRNADGTLARLTPYLGMAGHAVVQRSDGEVYIHLHPNGTVSMGAQQALISRRVEDTLPGMVARRLTSDAATASAPHDMHGEHGTHGAAAERPAFEGTLMFPYAFPAPGTYNVWVQFVREGQRDIETAVFAVTVQ